MDQKWIDLRTQYLAMDNHPDLEHHEWERECRRARVFVVEKPDYLRIQPLDIGVHAGLKWLPETYIAGHCYSLEPEEIAFYKKQMQAYTPAIEPYGKIQIVSPWYPDEVPEGAYPDFYGVLPSDIDVLNGYIFQTLDIYKSPSFLKKPPK